MVGIMEVDSSVTMEEVGATDTIKAQGQSGLENVRRWILQ